jgi:hypothetical protein
VDVGEWVGSDGGGDGSGGDCGGCSVTLTARGRGGACGDGGGGCKWVGRW